MPKKRKPYTYTLNTIKPGFRVVDGVNTPHEVGKVFYKNEYKDSGLLTPVALMIKNLKTKKQKKISVSVFYNNYKVFNEKSFRAQEANANTTGIGFYSSKPEVKEKDSYLNSLFEDGENERRNPLSPIIEAIKKQIKEESRIKKETDLTLMYDEIHKHFNGFIARRGVFADAVANLILRIDWMGNSIPFKAFKEENFEESNTHSVVVISSTNKLKTFFIRILRRIILKYPKYPSNGGK